jgi:hypothetical protein
MKLNEKADWSWDGFIEQFADVVDRYHKLLRQWNRAVGDFNEVYARKRPMGRPLQASDAQCGQVLKLRETGCSYAEIMDETNLSMRRCERLLSSVMGRTGRTVSMLNCRRLQSTEPSR